MDDSVDFYRGWDDYVAGFGDLCGNNLWVGLDRIHAMTAAYDTELNVYMQSYENEGRSAGYSSFSVDDASSGYRLKVSGYSGTAGDAMTIHDDLPFSTYDHDQDDSTDKNCAEVEKGAWWFADCGETNPNGVYNESITWRPWKGEDYSFQVMAFSIRRLNWLYHLNNKQMLQNSKGFHLKTKDIWKLTLSGFHIFSYFVL